MTTATTSTFDITVTGTYTRDEIPPRCRKPRPVTYPATTTVRVPQVTADQAPVAFRVHNNPLTAPTPYRHWGGNLYTKWRPSVRDEPVTPGSTMFPAEQEAERYRLGPFIASEAAFAERVRDLYEDYLIVDGIVWVISGEPRYVVQTFGTGHNHGGTSVLASDTDNPNLRSESYFRADEPDAAAAYAIDAANERGDTESVARLQSRQSYERIEVLISEAVTLVTVPPEPRHVHGLRFDYSSAVDRLSNLMRSRLNPATAEEEARQFEKVARLREQIIQAGCSPIEPTSRPYEARNPGA